MAPSAHDSVHVRQLKALLGQAKQVIASKDMELRAAAAQRTLARTQVEELQARLRDLENRSGDSDLKTKVAELEARNAVLRASQTDTASLRAELEQRDERIRQLEAAVRAKDAKIQRLEQDLEEGLAWGDATADDDLKQIRGIGPGFERSLKQLGVRKLAQIASWKPEDIQRIAAQLRTRPERIVREGWVECARRLTGMAVDSG